MDKTISVIIPFYDEPDFIQQAVDSCLSQTYEPDEIIVVDDGSDHNIYDLLSEHKGTNGVKIISHERNKGAAGARNTGIKHSTGEFIAFLDADDTWLPIKLESQLETFEAKPEIGMVYTDFYKKHPNGDRISIKAMSNPAKNFAKRLFVKGGGILPSSAMVRRNCLDQVGYFNESLEVAHDRNLWIRIGARWPVTKISKPLVEKRVRPNSLASTYSKKFDNEMESTNHLINELPQLKKYERKRNSFLFCNKASFLLQTGRPREARYNALKSIKLYPFNAKSYLITVVAFSGIFSDDIWEKLKFAKRYFSS